MKNRTIEELLDNRTMLMNLQHFAEPSDQDKNDDHDGNGDDDSDGDDHDDDSNDDDSKGCCHYGGIFDSAIHDQSGATSWRDWRTYCNNWRTCRCIFAA